jgi:acyl dehydratase
MDRALKGDKTMALNYEAIMDYRPDDIAVNYGARECILYALGIGIGMDPIDTRQLRFVYERANLTAFPSMAVVLGWPGRMVDPRFGVDARMVVAAGLKVVLHRPLKPEDRLIGRPRIREVVDLGADKAAIIMGTRELTTPSGERVATIDNSTLARKHGGFGGKVTQAPEAHAVPAGAPQAVYDLPTPPNLALLYRLNGDENPLHVEPELARKVGFDRPILHGAATFGVAAHAVVRHIDYRAEALHSIEARFAKPVFPGDTLRTEIWRDGNRISFQCRAAGRDDVVLTSGLAVLRD